MGHIVIGDETYLFFEQEQPESEWRFDHEDTPRVPR